MSYVDIKSYVQDKYMNIIAAALCHYINQHDKVDVGFILEQKENKANIALNYIK